MYNVHNVTHITYTCPHGNVYSTLALEKEREIVKVETCSLKKGERSMYMSEKKGVIITSKCLWTEEEGEHSH